MSRYLVTGATGFLGRHLVARLATEGHDVVALVRTETRDLAGATQLRGDVLDRATVDAAATGCAGVFHCAGRVSRDPRDAEALRELHVVGTRNVLAAAKAAGVRRVVVASSSGTIAISESDTFIANEQSKTPLGLIQRFPYYRTKLHQEMEALAANGAELEVVCVNPSLLLGPGDVHGSSTRDVWLFLTRAIPAVPAGGVAYVDVRDAAQGMALAMSLGAPGQRYLLNGSNVTVHELFARLSRVSGVAPPRLRLPRSRAFATTATSLLSRAVRVIGGELAVDPESVEMGQLFWYADAGRAERELGFRARDPLVTLADTVRDLTSKPTNTHAPQL